MMSIRKLAGVLVPVLLLGTAFAAPASAAVISISPASQDALIGDTVVVDILVSGLAAGESVGGVSLLLSFDDSVLSGASYTVDPDAKMGTADCESSFPGLCDQSSGFDGGSGSPLELLFLADFLTHAELKALQGEGFRLATLSFTAIGNGLSNLLLTQVPTEGRFMSDAEGDELSAQAENGKVCVGGTENCESVPEPGLLCLLGAGLSAAAVRRRARARA